MNIFERLALYYGAFSAGLFSGGAVAIAIMTHWYWLMDRHGWDGASAPDWLFAVHVSLALLSGGVTGDVVMARAKHFADRVANEEFEKRIVGRTLERTHGQLARDRERILRGEEC